MVGKKIMQILTDEQIESDIEAFRARISAAQKKIDMLPGGHLPYLQHKKRKEQRRLLNEEIVHVQRLAAYAQEALTEV